MTTRRPHPIRVVIINPPTPQQAQAMIRNAAPQLAALLDWWEKRQQEEPA